MLSAKPTRRIIATEEELLESLARNRNNRMLALLELDEQGFMFVTINNDTQSIPHWTANIEEMPLGSFVPHNNQSELTYAGHMARKYAKREVKGRLGEYKKKPSGY